jgi:ABC-type amino acid transport substrate-binding protein
VRYLFVTLVVLPLFLAAAPACAEEKNRVVKVGLCATDPFVIDLGSGNYSGLACNVWEMVAARLGVKSEYVLYHSLGQFFEDVHIGKSDIVVGNLAVNHDRTKNLKFSFPWYDDGLRILVKNRGQSLSAWSILQQRGQIAVYIWIALLVVTLTIGQALLRRRKDADFPIGWLEGVSLSFYEVVRSAKSGTIQKNFLGWAGYIILTVWMLFGFGLLAYVTSTLTSAMTTAGMQRSGDINSLNDLPGKRVVVIAHSIGERYMRETGARLLLLETMEEAMDALMKDDADALVMDAAELEYWVHSRPKVDVEVVGNIFNPFKYAFAANKKHAHLMDLVSEEVIRLLGDGTVESLKDKYFGRVRF